MLETAPRLVAATLAGGVGQAGTLRLPQSACDFSPPRLFNPCPMYTGGPDIPTQFDGDDEDDPPGVEPPDVQQRMTCSRNDMLVNNPK